MRSLFPIIFIIISVTAFFMFVNPLYSKVKATRTTIASLNQAQDNATELERKQNALLSSYTSISQINKDRLNHFLPNTVNNIEFILEVQRIANLHNIIVEGIKFTAPTSETTTTTASTTPGGNGRAGTGQATQTTSDPTKNLPYGTFDLEFSFEATYETFTAFVDDLEHNLRLLDIKSISFTVPTGTTNGGTGGTMNTNMYKYTLKVQTYWLKH